MAWRLNPGRWVRVEGPAFVGGWVGDEGWEKLLSESLRLKVTDLVGGGWEEERGAEEGAWEEGERARGVFRPGRLTVSLALEWEAGA